MRFWYKIELSRNKNSGDDSTNKKSGDMHVAKTTVVPWWYHGGNTVVPQWYHGGTEIETPWSRSQGAMENGLRLLPYVCFCHIIIPTVGNPPLETSLGCPGLPYAGHQTAVWDNSLHSSKVQKKNYASRGMRMIKSSVVAASTTVDTARNRFPIAWYCLTTDLAH